LIDLCSVGTEHDKLAGLLKRTVLGASQKIKRFLFNDAFQCVFHLESQFGRCMEPVRLALLLPRLISGLPEMPVQAGL
jgi:hypothetical protein|tara:strand:+ start:318 stop:551 length:234 start_codon:yes stop_codon:yes gene_type:complete